MDWRSIAPLLILLGLLVFGITLSLACASISTWITALILVGLLLDGIGAVVIVGPEITNLERRWRSENAQSQIETLLEGKDQLVGEYRLNESDTGISEIGEIVRHYADLSPTRDDDIFLTDPVEITFDPYDETIDIEYEDNGTLANLGVQISANRLENLVAKRIESLRAPARTQMIRDGARVLVLGFALQFIGMAIQRLSGLQSFLISNLHC